MSNRSRSAYVISLHVETTNHHPSAISKMNNWAIRRQYHPFFNSVENIINTNTKELLFFSVIISVKNKYKLLVNCKKS